MRKAEPNWNLERIPVSFPYIRLLFRGGPPAGTSRPRMAREHRAKLFAPFDALDGFSETIRTRDRELTDDLDHHGSP